MNSFSSLLVEFRENAGLSQAKLAKKAGLTPGYISRIEGVKRAPERDVVDKLADALELNEQDRNRFVMSAGFLPADPSYLLNCQALQELDREYVLASYEQQAQVHSTVDILLRALRSYRIENEAVYFGDRLQTEIDGELLENRLPIDEQSTVGMFIRAAMNGTLPKSAFGKTDPSENTFTRHLRMLDGMLALDEEKQARKAKK